MEPEEERGASATWKMLGINLLKMWSCHIAWGGKKQFPVKIIAEFDPELINIKTLMQWTVFWRTNLIDEKEAGDVEGRKWWMGLSGIRGDQWCITQDVKFTIFQFFCSVFFSVWYLFYKQNFVEKSVFKTYSIWRNVEGGRPWRTEGVREGGDQELEENRRACMRPGKGRRSPNIWAHHAAVYEFISAEGQTL